MLYQPLTPSQAGHLLLKDEYGSWSYHGAMALAEWLDDISDELGENLEFDVVAIRCDYSEYASLEEAATEYGFDDPADLYENTQVIEFDGGVIIQCF